MHFNTILADTAVPQVAAQAITTGTTNAQPSSIQQLIFGSPVIFYVLIFVVFYFVLIRPQQKRAKELAKLVGSLKSGDKVITTSGVVGTVISVKDTTVTLKSFDAKMEVTKSSVTQILEGNTVIEA